MQWPKESNTEAFSAFTVATTERYENFLVGPAFDYDGDGRADRAIWRPSERRFYVEPSSSPSEVRQSRVFPEGSHPAPGDYDGDGLWDDAAWIQVGSDTRFEIIHSSGAPDRSVVFDGFSATHAVSGDFDGDGRHDPGVYAAEAAGAGCWLIARSRDGRQELHLGRAGDIPTLFGWRGDRSTGFALFRPSSLEVLRRGSATFRFGSPDDDPVTADYDGDGIEDYGVRRSQDRTWYIRQSSDQRVVVTRFGCANDVPVAADFDGDLKVDLAIFRSDENCLDDLAEHSWQYRSSMTQRSVTLPPFGRAGDVPVQAAYRACANSGCEYPR